MMHGQKNIKLAYVVTTKHTEGWLSCCQDAAAFLAIRSRWLTIRWKTCRTDSATKFHGRLEFQNSYVVVESEDAEVAINFSTGQFPFNSHRLCLVLPVVFP